MGFKVKISGLPSPPDSGLASLSVSKNKPFAWLHPKSVEIILKLLFNKCPH
jgi:hypothetical protein